MKAKRFVTQPLDQDEQFIKLIEAFPVGVKFPHYKAREALGVDDNGTNAAYVSTYLHSLKRTLGHCPEGVQLHLDRSGGCHFYNRA